MRMWRFRLRRRLCRPAAKRAALAPRRRPFSIGADPAPTLPDNRKTTSRQSSGSEDVSDADGNHFALVQIGLAVNAPRMVSADRDRIQSVGGAVILFGMGRTKVACLF